MIIQIYKPYIKKYGSIKEVIKKSYFVTWDEQRIKNAFNFGDGSAKDFKRYKEDNKQYCLFLEVK